MMRQVRPDPREWQSRVRLERRLHDGPALRLAALALGLGQVADQVAEMSAADERLRDRISGLQSELNVALDELRDLGSAILPPLLTSHGIGTALEAVAEQRQIPVGVSIAVGRLPRPVEAAAYFTVVGVLETSPPGALLHVQICRRRNWLVVRMTQRPPRIADDARVLSRGTRGPRDLVVRIPCG
jgi:hypothetical protein